MFKNSWQKIPNRRCPTTTHQTQCTRALPRSPNKHSQTPKPCLQNCLEPKIPRDKKNRVLQDPTTETPVIADHKYITHLQSEITRAPDPRSQKLQPSTKRPSFPIPHDLLPKVTPNTKSKSQAAPP